MKSLLSGLLIPGLVVAGVALVSLHAHASSSWQSLARQSGQSEEYRAGAIRSLKSMKDLKTTLRQALKTADRPLALEVIGALEMKSLVPDIRRLQPTDKDGFLTLALNAMMDESNRAPILDAYSESLRTLKPLTAPVIVAMLEPLGRLNRPLPRATLVSLSRHESPDVRSGLLYYLRVLALRHRHNDNMDLIDQLKRSSEVQLRLQAASVAREIEMPHGLIGRNQ